MKKDIQKNRGQILIQVIVFSTIASVLLGGLLSWASGNIVATREAVKREEAIQIAEAGIDYYRWHLAHSSNDFQDGSTTPGAYVHYFYDINGNILGTFTLNITPPATGTTLVLVKSTGTVASTTISRSIAAKFAIPSLAKYAVVANDNLRFGAGTVVYGPIDSNGGIHFDGVSHNLISSALSSYTDPDFGLNEFGVYTQVSPADPQPPASVPTRNDVFQAGRLFPVPAVDFTGMTANLSQLKTLAQSGGKYISASGAQGYHIIFKTNDTFDLYKVTTLQAIPGGCVNDLSQTNWGTWSIKSSGGQTLVGNYPVPTNGIIFVEDNLWVDGQINTARVTVAAGKFPDNPATRPAITVNTNLLYTNYDGSDVLALISQGDVNVGLFSDNSFEIDGALVAQNGRAGRDYYDANCGASYIRSTLTLYGMIATNLRYGFSYTDGTGYATRNITYDANLLYGPPPSFPLTSNQYSLISWQEVK
jgi:hypothetical protein